MYATILFILMWCLEYNLEQTGWTERLYLMPEMGWVGVFQICEYTIKLYTYTLKGIL